MSDKPSYLGLLNAIAIAESRACAYLTAWAGVTRSADVRGVLLKVAAREGEHGMSFAKRINELGFQVRDKDDGDLASKMEIAQSACTDLEKMEAFGLHKLDTRDKPDLFDGFFRDHSIDIQTGELLGRYIAEERDSGRVLRACYEQLRAASSDRDVVAAAESDRLARVEEKVDAICLAIQDLRGVVAAQAKLSEKSRK